jgi:crossover junction endodeoxyribonuclease RuvC
MIRLPIAAIDPSLTSTGVCLGTDETDWIVKCCGSKPRGKTVLDRVRRYEGLLQDITRILDAIQPRLILIEEYAYSKNMGGQMYLGEFGGLLRWHLCDYTPHVIEVTASCLKKFATGKGNAPKDVVMAHVAQRYGKLFANNDEADSFVLYQMALCIAGRQEPQTQPQREAVDKVLSGHTATGQQIAEFCLDTGAEKPF